MKFLVLIVSLSWVSTTLAQPKAPPAAPSAVILAVSGDRDSRIKIGPPIFNRPMPLNAVTPKYTPAWFEAEDQVNRFKNEYGRQVVVINRKAPASVTFGQEVIVWQTPLWALAGNNNPALEWLYVEDLLSLLAEARPTSTSPVVDQQTARAVAKIQAIEAILKE